MKLLDPVPDIAELGDAQRANLAFRAWATLTGVFEQEIQPPPDVLMTRLLLVIYACEFTHWPVAKKSIGEMIGAQDIKTARKYIARAIEQGFVITTKSSQDRRSDLLKTTEEFREVAKKALARYYSDILETLKTVSAYAPESASQAQQQKTVADEHGRIIASMANLERTLTAAMFRATSGKFQQQSALERFLSQKNDSSFPRARVETITVSTSATDSDAPIKKGPRLPKKR